MYEYFCAVVVGIVEGLTEYIPVSSTGHMIIVGHMLGFEGTLADLFDVFIQLGAILSVLVVYREKFKFILNTHHWFRRRGPSVLNVAISMFPACLMGLIFHDFIKHKLFSPYTVIIGLVLGGVFMIFAEKKRKKSFRLRFQNNISRRILIFICKESVQKHWMEKAADMY